MTATVTVAALARAALAGPYFAMSLDSDELLWRPFSDLLDRTVLLENVAQVRRVLSERTQAPVGDLDLRACASIHALGLAARLTAPARGSAALAGHVPSLAVARLRWQRVAGGPVPVALIADIGRDVGSIGGAAEAIHELVIAPVVQPLIDAFATTFALSQQVLWGNVASSLAGAATMLARSGQPARLDLEGLARAVTQHGALAGMGDWTGYGFVRRNCCLFYKIPGGGKCGDCVLISTATRAGEL